MKKIIIVVCSLILLSLVVIRVGTLQRSVYQPLHGGGATLRVEVATTPEAITKGLGDRDSIGSDGMLFVLPTRHTPTFWMRGMRFDLDFVWIDGNKIVDLTANVKAEPGVAASLLHLYTPNVVVTRVLELPAGSIARYNLKIGEDVTP